jgi:hypothetical protein
VRVTHDPVLGAAALLGCSPATYRARVAAGEKWCTDCQEWHPREAFGRDRSQRSGLARRCKVARRERDARRRNAS